MREEEVHTFMHKVWSLWTMRCMNHKLLDRRLDLVIPQWQQRFERDLILNLVVKHTSWNILNLNSKIRGENTD